MGPDASHEKWVSNEQLRMPRLTTDESVAGKPVVQCNQWQLHTGCWEAHTAELRRWKEKPPHTMMETMEIVRKDLAVVPPLFSPAGYTTIVEGRPVQALRYNLKPFWELSFLAWSRHFREHL